jgi:hypothetical protein
LAHRSLRSSTDTTGALRCQDLRHALLGTDGAALETLAGALQTLLAQCGRPYAAATYVPPPTVQAQVGLTHALVHPQGRYMGDALARPSPRCPACCPLPSGRTRLPWLGRRVQGRAQRDGQTGGGVGCGWAVCGWGGGDVEKDVWTHAKLWEGM